MPIKTRSQALKGLRSVSASVRSDGAALSDAPASAQPITISPVDGSIPSGAVVPASPPATIPREDGNSSQEITAGPSHSQVNEFNSSKIIAAPTISTSSRRSTSSTIQAQQLAARANHARRLIEAEKRIYEREKYLADIELQAEIAAIKSGSSRSSSINKVEDWLTPTRECIEINKAPSGANMFPDGKCNIQKAQPDGAGFGTSGCDFMQDYQDQYTTPHAPFIGTHHTFNDENCDFSNYKIKNNEINTQNFNALAEAITELGRKKSRVSHIPKFDGNPAHWLLFKRAFEQSKAQFSPSDNILRITEALHGPAREAVLMLLLSSDDPDQIVGALENRFAQPEIIVLEQLSLVRTLPRLPAYDNPRELNIFACRIRNCVETIRLLNQSEYLAAPEMVNTIVGKLTPLLRSKWVDFAAANITTGKFRLEILADFLDIEANLQIKFGFVLPDSLLSNKNQQRFAKDKIYTSYESQSSKSFIICKYCSANDHEVSDCTFFKNLSFDDRWQWVVQNKLCHKCLKKGSHQYKSCKFRCGITGCKADSQHHRLLHRDSSVSTAHVEVDSAPLPAVLTEVQSNSNRFSDSGIGVPTQDQAATVAHSSAIANFQFKPLLKVIAVTITGPLGSVDTYALLDDGSSATLLDQAIADKIGASGPKCSLNIDCIGGLKKRAEVQYVDVSVKGLHSSKVFTIRARSISNLGINSQSTRMDDIIQYKYLSDLVDVLCYVEAKPMLLIGLDNWQVTLPTSVRRGKRYQPAAIHTALGWVLFGYMPQKHFSDNFNHLTTECDLNNDQSLDAQVKNYFQLDSIGILKVNHRNSNDQRALKILEDTTKLLSTGRYETSLLWRENINFVPESRDLALARFNSLERKMARDKSYAEDYKQNIHGMISKGYAELCLGPPSSKLSWYLPHFGVIHPQKKKLRVVHDAAAKCSGVSLNSLLLTGPDLLQPLLSIVMRFREGQVAVTGDIKEMFPQIKIRSEDRDSQRFLWRDSPNLPIQEFRMSSMIFGAVSSPCTALWVKNKNARNFENKFPDAVRLIIEDHYMDDFLGSFDNVGEAAQRASEILAIHKAACFEMRSWVSNYKGALALVPSELHATDASEVNLGPTSPSQTRVLGLTWNVNDDRLHFMKSLQSLPAKFTKRSVLSVLMSIFDPLGFLTPIIMKGRVLFQKTWKLGIDWDKELSVSMVNDWVNWFQQVRILCNGSIPRCYLGVAEPLCYTQLHIFADASERAYACVAYWRFIFKDGSVRLALIGSKGRLAPLKPVSIPRLELQAALIAARFGTYIVEAHRRKPNQIFYWTDSITVLKWLRSDACTFKAFVSFRVGEIAELTDIQNWRYVPSSLNVADDATRDSKFSNSSRWFTGPPFLLAPQSEWPLEPESSIPPMTEELKCNSELVGLTDFSPQQLPSPVVADHQRFSSWLRLLRSTARIHQCAKIFRSTIYPNLKYPADSVRDIRNYHLLTVEDLNVAEVHLFQKMQIDSFLDELIRIAAVCPVSKDSRLKNISLFLDDRNLLCLSGRTTAIADIEPHPVVLDGKHLITRLLIHFYHAKFAHGNNELVVNEMRQKFYVIGLRPSVRGVAQRCQFCRIRKAKPITPPLGDLPAARLAHHQRPYTHVGLDYFGPINVAIGRRTAKRWIALFTCLTVRAIHLEIVENLSSDSALMALRRFISRRGCPAHIYSDNGTSFVGAAKMLPELFDFCTNNKIKWHFIPPSAPFMGGCWERLVRSVKNSIVVTLKDRLPKEEILYTFLLEAEGIINSRPLTHVSVDIESDHAITPFTFLIGTTSYDFSVRTFDDSDLYRRPEWKKAQRLADHFWERFVKEYIPTLLPRKTSPETRQLKIGDLVFIADGSLPRSCWPRGRVAAVHPGKDGIVRVVDVVTKGGMLRRPTRKVVLLVASG